MSRPRSTNNLLLFFVATAIASLLTYLLWHFSPNLNYLLSERMGAHPDPDTIINVLKLILIGVVAYLLVRALNSLIFGLTFRLRSGFAAPTLVRNVFTIIAFTIFFLIAFNSYFPDVNLGALFTTHFKSVTLLPLEFSVTPELSKE